jgi:hypothetical protein
VKSDTVIALVALGISIASFFRGEWREALRRRAQLEVWQRNSIFLHVGGAPVPPTPTRVTLLFRNLTSRPASVVDV